MAKNLKDAVWSKLVRLNGTDPEGYNIAVVRREVLKGGGCPTLKQIDEALRDLASEGLIRKEGYRHRFTEAGHAKAGIVPAHAS